MDIREQWLHDMAEAMRSKYNEVGLEYPENLKISCGFTSSGTKGKALGECWDPSVSENKNTEIYISPICSGSEQALHVLAHELVHACLGIEAGHGKKFSEACKKVHLQKPWKATTPTEEFMPWVQPFIDKYGEFPHSPMNIGQIKEKKKQPHTKHINLRCPIDGCEVFIKTALEFVEQGMEFKCPDCDVRLLSKSERDGMGEEE